MKVIIVNGFPQSGKTTFENYCIAINPIYIINISTIDCIKKLASQIGWDGNKDDKNRKFLSDLKKLTTEYNDYSYNQVLNQIHAYQFKLSQYDLDPSKIMVFVDCREPEEIKKYVDRLNAKTVLLTRPGMPLKFSNESDANVMNFEYDEIIWNNGSLDNLREQAKLFVSKELE